MPEASFKTEFDSFKNVVESKLDSQNTQVQCADLVARCINSHWGARFVIRADEFDFWGKTGSPPL